MVKTTYNISSVELLTDMKYVKFPISNYGYKKTSKREYVYCHLYIYILLYHNK